MDDPATLPETVTAEMTLWAFCRCCGHASLFDPQFLRGKVKDGDERLSAMAAQFKCSRCNRADVRLIPTPRTMVSFEKMGTARP